MQTGFSLSESSQALESKLEQPSKHWGNFKGATYSGLSQDIAMNLNTKRKHQQPEARSLLQRAHAYHAMKSESLFAHMHLGVSCNEISIVICKLISIDTAGREQFRHMATHRSRRTPTAYEKAKLQRHDAMNAIAGLRLSSGQSERERRASAGNEQRQIAIDGYDTIARAL